jgi:predicted RNA-binding protein with PUA-like domain
MARFLFKTEPSEYSFDDLVRDHFTRWDGVTNALARKHLRGVKEGDEVVIYHTGGERRAVGLARIVKGAHSDPTSKDANSVVVDLRAGRRLPRPVTLAELKGSSRFAGFDLLRLGRLSVMPVSDAHWAELLRLAGLAAR